MCAQFLECFVFHLSSSTLCMQVQASPLLKMLCHQTINVVYAGASLTPLEDALSPNHQRCVCRCKPHPSWRCSVTKPSTLCMQVQASPLLKMLCHQTINVVYAGASLTPLEDALSSNHQRCVCRCKPHPSWRCYVTKPSTLCMQVQASPLLKMLCHQTINVVYAGASLTPLEDALSPNHQRIRCWFSHLQLHLTNIFGKCLHYGPSPLHPHPHPPQPH